jgi:thioredoxin:protein disulfide reductase
MIRKRVNVSRNNPIGRRSVEIAALLAAIFLATSVGARADGGKVTLTLEATGEAAPRGGMMPLDIFAHIERGWHINAHKPTDAFLIPTDIALKVPAGVTAEPMQYPPPDRKKFAFAPGQELLVYEGKLGVATALHVPAEFADSSIRVTATLRYQACNDTLCLPPATTSADLLVPVTAAVAPTAVAPPAAANGGASGGIAIDDWLSQRGLLFTIFAVALLGIGLNLTPCVYPLISVTVAYFGGHGRGHTGRKGLLATVYVLGIALSFAALGVLAALSGGLFGAAMQKPIVVLFIAGIMVALALSSFGLYQIRPPARLMQWAGGSAGGLAGAAFMGLTMGIVAAPCIGPMVLALLVAVGARQDPLLGFALFFALGCGMGLPYLVLAVVVGSIHQLPRSGEWLVWSERLFGFILLGMAAYFVTPLLPRPIRDWLLPGLIAIAGIYLGFIDPSGRTLRTFRPIKRAVGLAALSVALWLAWPHRAESAIEWQRLAAGTIQTSQSANRPVVIEFGADWCIPCAEMARTTFADPKVVRASAGFDMVKVDITEETPENKQLLERFDVRGVPTLLVFDGTGKEVDRLVGYSSSDELLEAMRKAADRVSIHNLVRRTTSG